MPWRQVGHTTQRKFMELYKAYKDTFDLENVLRVSGKTYAELEELQKKDEGEWF